MSARLLSLLDAVVAEAPIDPTYLFFPGYLTPNGELHLGHIGGPYLRSDATARHLRSLGAQVTTMTGADTFESGVTYRAYATGVAPDEIAERFSERAQQALSQVDIDVDFFVTPSAPTYRRAFTDLCESAASALTFAGRVVVEPERLFPVAPASPERVCSPRWAVAAFLAGNCWRCGADQSGNVCEECGVWLPPETLDRPMAGDARPDAERVEHRGAFVKAAPALRPEALAGRVEPGYVYLVRDYQARFGTLLRLTYPLPWGVRWGIVGPDGAAPDPDSVHSSYLTGKYASTRLVGAAYAERFGCDPFAPDSSVTTVAVGGLDSAMGWVATAGLAWPEIGFRPYDHVVINRFMQLDGSKFSTSRRHVIRVADAAGRGLTADAIRLLLARVSPSSVETNFVPAKVVAGYTADIATLGAALRAPVENHQSDAGSDRGLALLRRQRAAFRLPAVDVPAAVAVLMDHARDLAALSVHSRTDRALLALLAGPLVPGWARAVWRTAGLAGDPGREALLSGQETAAVPVPDFVSIDEALLNALVEQGRSKP